MNVIYIIIDSLCYERLDYVIKKFGSSCFLTKFVNEGISFEKMYSQAPYTEAAAQAIYCSQKTMDNGGHLFRFKNAKRTVFESFKIKAYSTFYSNVLLQLYTSSTKRGVDTYYYNNGFEMGGLWNYRLSYYSDLYEQSKMDEKDFANVRIIMDENFCEWEHFFASLSDEMEDTRLIRSTEYAYDISSNSEKMRKEYARYKENENAYIIELLTLRKDHPLFQICDYTESQKLPYAVCERTWEKHKRTIRKIQRKQFSSNLLPTLFCADSVAELKKVIHKKCLQEFRRYLISQYMFLFPMLLNKKVFLHYDGYKVAPSIDTFIQSFMEWHKINSHDEYFACIHVDDIHHPEIFFTYDTEDEKVIDDEFAFYDKELKRMGAHYRGPLLYDLGILNVSNTIKKLYSYIKGVGQLDNTMFVITSDHGFSFQGTPIRESNVSTFYKENYHIPFIVYQAQGPTGVIRSYHNSYEIPDIIEKMSTMQEHLELSSVGFSSIEFMGAGCPDLRRKKVKLACFNDDLMVTVESRMYDCITSNDVGIYDLKNDPKQLHLLRYHDIDITYKHVTDQFIDYFNVRLAEIRNQCENESD